MIEFWLPAAILLLTALAFVAVPLLRLRGTLHATGHAGPAAYAGGANTAASAGDTGNHDATHNRTAQNIGLYQDRLKELDAQHEAGLLTPAQLAAGRTEAARELLADAGRIEAAHEFLADAGRTEATGEPLADAGRTTEAACELLVDARCTETARSVSADNGYIEATRQRSADPGHASHSTACIQNAACIPSAIGMVNTGGASSSAPVASSAGKNPGERVAWVAALLVPLLGIILYLHWGSLDQVIQARQSASHPTQSIAQMTARLEASLAQAPDSAEAWFFLGRTYLAQDRPADAAQAFERATTLAGRPAELLGHWAQALYFAGDQQWTPQLQALVDEALAADPDEPASLTLAGMAAFEAGRYAEAATHWEHLAATLPEEDPTRQTIAEGIARARALISTPDQPNGQSSTPTLLP